MTAAYAVVLMEHQQYRRPSPPDPLAWLWILIMLVVVALWTAFVFSPNN